MPARWRLRLGFARAESPCHAVEWSAQRTLRRYAIRAWEKRLALANEHLDATLRWAIAGRAGGGDADRLRAALARRGVDAKAARWFATTDFDELQEAVTSGEVTAVLFADVATMMEGMFDDRLRLHEWAARGVRIELLDTPSVGASLVIAEGAVDARTLLAIEAAWRAWFVSRRRRRAIAGAVLSVLAILAATAAVLISMAIP